jgi:hypothetical protein
MRICLSSYKRLSKAVLKASSLSSTTRGSSPDVCRLCRWQNEIQSQSVSTLITGEREVNL